MTTKKLYKFKTELVFYEIFEVEAESYEEACASIDKGRDNWEDDYPLNVDRVGFWFGDKHYSNEDDYPGVVAISINEEEADKTPYYNIYKTEGLALGHWREPTDEEIVDDEKQAVADGRLKEEFARYN